MGNAIEFEMMAIERSGEMIRVAKERQRADEAERSNDRRGIVAFIFGRRRAA